MTMDLAGFGDLFVQPSIAIGKTFDPMLTLDPAPTSEPQSQSYQQATSRPGSQAHSGDEGPAISRRTPYHAHQQQSGCQQEQPKQHAGRRIQRLVDMTSQFRADLGHAWFLVERYG